MGVSDKVAEMIEDMLEQSGGMLIIRRNDLAGKMGCVPSQINYVISSRFTPQRGYIVESKRGGGGYVRIIRRDMSASEYLMHFFAAIGDSIDQRSAEAYIANLTGAGFVSERERDLCVIALSAAPDDEKRAGVLRQLTLAVMKQNK
ncbi:MAG: CtsR family transcriptional regulator [Clostridia bacterium]|nr:CtsR family transcriptional regulator [Clostridia bacterium]